MKFLVRSGIALFLALSALFHIETAYALTCEQLFTSDLIDSTNRPRSEVRSSYKTYEDYQKDLQNPDLFFAVLEGERTVPADVMLVHLEHFHNYKHRDLQMGPLTQIHLPLQENVVTVDLNQKKNENGLVGWLISEDKKEINYFIHPTNTSDNVPFFNETHRHEKGPVAVSTASRSMMIRTEAGDIYSIKMGTDYPEGKDNQRNLKKLLYVQTEVEQGIAHAKALHELQKRFGHGKTFSMTTEVASVTPETEIIARYGMLVRDLNFLKTQDRYYLPAFSIPFIGPSIAKKFGQKYEDFWNHHFAEVLGAAKAELFLRYGMTMTWPHGQNILIETDSQFRPTGVIKIRDIDDIQFYDTAVQHLLPENFAYDVEFNNEVHFYWERSEQVLIPPSQRDHASRELKDLAARWHQTHDKAIRRILAKHLEIPELLDESKTITKILLQYKNKVDQFFQKRSVNK